MDTEQLFRQLADQDRRRVLIALCQTASVRVPDGIRTRSVAADAEGRDQLELKLMHQDLPKLEAHGLIEWDRDESVVRRGPTFEEIEPVLSLCLKHTNRFPSSFR